MMRKPGLSFFYGIVLLSGIYGCRSVPSGPAPEGPIIVGRPEAERFDGKSAVNYMLTSLITRCAPIAGAGANPPRMTNVFQVTSEREANELPMELWQSLIRQRLITPCRPDAPMLKFRLRSQFTVLPTIDGNRRLLWELKLDDLLDENQIWHDKREFILPQSRRGDRDQP